MAPIQTKIVDPFDFSFSQVTRAEVEGERDTNEEGAPVAEVEGVEANDVGAADTGDIAVEDEDEEQQVSDDETRSEQAEGTRSADSGVQAAQARAGTGGLGSGAGLPASSGGMALQAQVQAQMEHAFQTDFSGVTIHPDSQRAAGLGALAYTEGSSVHMAPGQYDPGSRNGRELIGHELAHVVQQREGRVSATGQAKGLAINEDPGLEKEADDFGRRAASGEVVACSAGPEMHSQPGAVQMAGSPLQMARKKATSTTATSTTGPDKPKATVSIKKKPRKRKRRKGKGQPQPGASVTIPAISWAGSTHRLPPGRSTSVAVTVTGLPPGQFVDMDVENSGTASGSATITNGARLAGSGNITVQGGTQTTPGNANTLRLRARVSGTTAGTSAGFTVAAWPRDFTTSLISDVDEPSGLGLRARNEWTSDGTGGKADLTAANRSELVDLSHRDNPPFTNGSGTSTTSGTSGYLAGTSPATIDRHSYPHASINTSGLGQGTYTIVYTQLFVLQCRRTGVNDVVVPNSGFTITHTVGWNAAASRWNHNCVKSAAATTVGAFSSSAGAGGATSLVHVL